MTFLSPARLLPVLLGMLLGATGCRHTSTGAHSGSKPSAIGATEVEPAEVDPARVEAHARYMAGIIHEMNGRAAPALKEFSRSAAKDATNSVLLLEVSERLLAAGKPQEALDLLTKSAAAADVSAPVLARLASVQARSGLTNEAMATSTRALAKDPAATDACRTLYGLLMQQRKFPEARALVDRTVAQTNLPTEFIVVASEMYALLGQAISTNRTELHADALKLLHQANDRHPADPDLRNKIADGFFLLGEADQASAIYLDLLKQYPDSQVVRTAVRAKLIEVLLRGKDRSAARQQLEALVRDNPGDSRAYFLLGSMAFEERKWDQAADYLGKAVLFSPEFEPAYYDLALAQINTKDIGEALRTLQKARGRFGDTYSFQFVAGLAEGSRTNWTAAVKHFTAAEIIAHTTDPKRLNEVLYFQLGSAYERAGNLEQAVAYLEKAIAAEPNFAEALNYLGYLWAERAENLVRAHELIARAVQLEPKNPAFLDSLGWVLYKQGKFAEARPYLEEALVLIEEPDATVFDHFGDVEAALGNLHSARTAWERSLKLDPTNDKVRHKLEAAPVAPASP